MGRKASHSIEINATPHQEDAPLYQVERFRRVAQELGGDDEAAFDEKLKRIAGHKPGEAPAKPTKAPPSF
jgi:hypothetical protein